MGFNIKYDTLAKSIANKVIRQMGYGAGEDAGKNKGKNTKEARRKLIDYAKVQTGLTLHAIVGSRSKTALRLMHPSVISTPNNKQASIRTRRSFLQRPSLKPEKYGNGVHNIVTLISLGYKVSHTYGSELARVYGVWTHHYGASRKVYKGKLKGKNVDITTNRKIWSLPERKAYTRYNPKKSGGLKMPISRTLDGLLDDIAREARSMNLPVVITAGPAISEAFIKAENEAKKNMTRRVSLYNPT